MKFKFTTTPLKDLPLGTVVDGYKLDVRSHTGKNAEGWRIHDGRHERVLLDRIKKLEDGERPNDERLDIAVNAWMKEGNGHALLDRMVDAAIEDSTSTPRGLERAVRQLFESEISLIDYIEEDDIVDKISGTLDDKVKEIVENLSFTVSVS